MQVELITKEDLQALRKDLLEDLKLYLSSRKEEQKKWMKSGEVRKMLNISPGTLQNLRINGQLRPTKIGGSFYYLFQDIQILLQSGNKK